MSTRYTAKSNLKAVLKISCQGQGHTKVKIREYY